MEGLRLWEIEIPFRRPLRTSSTSILTRSSVMVALEHHGATGWAEAPGFPSGRFGSARDAFDDLRAVATRDRAEPKVPIARAALEAARADAAARAEGAPLHTSLGASGAPVPARHPVGLLDPDEMDAEIAWLTMHGIVAIKAKIRPGSDEEPIRRLRQALPHLDIGVDANGTYRHPDDPVFLALDALEVSFLEQPFPPPDLELHGELRSRVRMAVCIDEGIDSVADAGRVVAVAAADQIAVKVNRLGLGTLRQVLDISARGGIGVQVGGTFDTSIGRRHLLAAATLPGVVDAAVGPPSAYLARDIGSYPAVRDGMVAPEPKPGIGFEPDVRLLDAYSSRRFP